MSKLTKAALTRLTKKASNGDANAQFVLANVYCYAAADGVIRDRIKAFEWAEKAAIQGHTCSAARYLSLICAIFVTLQHFNLWQISCKNRLQ